MKRGQLIGVAVAAVCGLGAFFLMKSIVSKPREIKKEIHTNTIDVLVARADIGLGSITSESNFRWQAWPQDAVPPAAVTRQSGTGMQDLAGAIARSPIMAGEPVTKSKLIKAGEGGVLASILPAGMLAVSTKISDDTAVGKMILPNDHVDVILTRRMRGKGGGTEEVVSETVFRNIRVLAIGQQLEVKDGKKNAEGTTATLELTSDQAEQLAQSRTLGEVSLALRSIADFNPQGGVDKPKKKETGRSDSVRVLEYGVRSRAYGLN
jgi:pilus assembly protein CpaB